ncbi:MAG TPA: molybdopterin-binding protein [Candidatus Nanoarchaeia archaeon]|nr:molybdopterin-binding protein [Candidatus Nanoarchaeia archaeon]
MTKRIKEKAALPIFTSAGKRGNMTITMELICIGNELLIGKVVNTNASWMGKRATALGVAVRRVTESPDEIPEIVNVVREALARKPNFIVTSGGLGPTFDDMTLEGLAKALNLGLIVNDEALDMIKAKYKEYSKLRNIPEGEMTPYRVKMATLPIGACPIFNPVGSAPGVRIDVDGTVLIALPGVPSEMEAIFADYIVPLLIESSGGVGFFEMSIYTNKIMESALAPLIDKVMLDNPAVYIKSHPKGRENRPHELHLSTTGKSEETPAERLRKASLELVELVKKSGGEVIKAETMT